MKRARRHRVSFKTPFGAPIRAQRPDSLPPQPQQARAHRKGRRTRRVLLGIGAGIGGLVGLAGLGVTGFVVYLKTEGGNEWLRAKVESLADGSAGEGDITIGRLETNGWGQWRIHGLDVTDAGGRTLAHVGRLSLDVNLRGLLHRELLHPTVILDDVTVDVTELEDGSTDLGNLFASDTPQPETTKKSNGLPIGIKDADVRIRGLSVTYNKVGQEGAVFSVAGAAAAARVSGARTTFVVQDLDLGAVVAQPGPAPVHLSGNLWVTDGVASFDTLALAAPGTRLTARGVAGSERMDLSTRIDSLDLARLQPLFGSPGVAGVFQGDVRIAGPMEAAQVTAALDGGRAGVIRADVTLDLEAEDLAYKGAVELVELKAHEIYPGIGQEIAVDGRLAFDGRGTSFPDGMRITGDYTGGSHDLAGQHLDAVRASFALENGKLTLESSQISGIVGDIEASGVVDVANGPMDLRVGGTLRPENLAELGAVGFGGDGRLDAHVVGNFKEIDTTGIRADGSVTYDRFTYGNDVRLANMRASFDARVVGSAVNATARVRTGPGLIYGAAVRSSDTRNVRLAVSESQAIRVSGNTTAVGVDYPDVFATDSAQARWQVNRSAAGHLRVGADVALTRYDLVGFDGTDGVAKIAMNGDMLSFDADLRDGERSAWRVVGDFATDTGDVTLAQLEVAPTGRATWVAQPGAHLRVADGGIEDADIQLSSNLGKIAVQGDLGTKGRLGGRLVTSGLQLDTFAELFPEQLSGLAGVADLDVALGGTATAATVDGTVSVKGLWVEGVTRWLDLEGTIQGADDLVRLDMGVGSAGEPLADIRGSVPINLDLSAPGILPRGDVDLMVSMRPGGLHRVERVAPAAPDMPQGKLSGVLEVRGELADPAIRVAGVAELPVKGWDHNGRLEFDVRRDGDRADVRIDARDGVTALGTITGGGTTRLGEVTRWATGATDVKPDFEDWTIFADDLEVNAALLGIPVEGLLAATGQTIDARGSLVGGFSVTGSPYAPIVEGGVNWLDPGIGAEDLGGAFFGLVPTDDGFEVALNMAFLEGGGLDVTGSVPIVPDLRQDFEQWVRGDLDITVGGGGVPIAVAAGLYPEITEATGIMKIEGTITGSPLDPIPDLTVALDDGAFNYVPLGLEVTDVDLRFDGEDRRFRLSKFSAHTEPMQQAIGFRDFIDGEDSSIIRAAGSVQVAGGVPDAVSVNVELQKGAWLSATPDQALRLEGDLVVSGRYPALSATGELDLHTGRMNIEMASLAENAPLTPDARLTIVRPRISSDEIIPVQEDTGPTLMESIVANVDVDLKRNMEIDLSMPFVDDFGSIGASVAKMDMTARLGGSTKVTFAEGVPSAVGQIDLLEGRVEVLRSEFDLEEGTITFSGGDIAEPTLDIDAKMTVTGGSVDLGVTGTPSDPEISLTSDTWADESTLFTILLTGQAPEDLTASEGSGASTTDALTSLALSSALAGASLGNVAIDANGVRVGVPISQTIYAESIVVREPAFDENQLTVHVEWTPIPQIVLDVAVGEVQRWSDVYWEVRF